MRGGKAREGGPRKKLLVSGEKDGNKVGAPLREKQIGKGQVQGWSKEILYKRIFYIQLEGFCRTSVPFFTPSHHNSKTVCSIYMCYTEDPFLFLFYHFLNVEAPVVCQSEVVQGRNSTYEQTRYKHI